MSSANVNLLSPAAGVSVQTSPISRSIRLLGIVSLSTFLGVGLVTAGFYFFFNTQLASIQEDEKTLAAKIGGLSSAEGLQVIILSRLDALLHIIAEQRDWKKFLSTLEAVSPLDGISSYVVDEDGQAVRLKLKPRSIAQAGDIVTKLTSLSHSRQITKARFDSIGLDPNGNIVLNVSFTTP